MGEFLVIFTAAKAAAIGVLISSSSFVAGRLSRRTPDPEIREKQVEVIKYVDRVEFRDRTVNVERDKVVRRVVRVLVSPGGGSSREEEDSTEERDRALEQASHHFRIVTEERWHERETIRIERDRWRVGVSGGLVPDRRLLDAGDFRWRVGGELSRRVLGGISAGILVGYGAGAVDVGIGLAVGF